MESAVRGWIDCMQQRKLDGTSNYIHSEYRQNGRLFSRDTFTDYLNETGARIFQGQLEEVQVSSDSEWIWTIDDLLVAEDAQCLWGNIIIRWPRSKLRREAPSAQETGDLTVAEHSFFWFTDGKISKREFVRDWEGLQAQLPPQGCSWAVDSIGGTPVPSMNTRLRLTHEGLDQRYRTYLGLVNAKQLESALSTEFWYSQFTRNGKPRFLDEFRAELAVLFSTMSDIRADIQLLLPDASKQRIHVHVKATCTFRSSKVEVRDHITYQFVDGRISRIWQFFDMVDLETQVSAIVGQGS
ncbi:hypothetical protein SLS53_003070 [Cytospora paraplurivora]|uniref:SnoaL-like domain-containing protein n=1 Tax=Cytospora paraplurivora TaxID=2898453 RepID=A0AAN9UFQ3_9PEZI